MKPIKVLHIFPDDKFFDSVSEYFDSFSKLENYYVFYTKQKNYTFKYIKQFQKILVINKWAEYIEYINDEKFDFVYLQAMYPPYIINHINPNKKVVWWCFGFEIYNPNAYLCKPIIPLNLYKPKTKKSRDIENSKKNIIKLYVKAFLYLLFIKPKKMQAIKRVNYFSPVLPIDYDLMKKYCKGFSAKPFMYNGGPGFSPNGDYRYISEYGNILIGNSLTYENNHLDIFNAIKNIARNERQKLIVPINYGNAYGGADNFIKISNLSNVLFLKDFMDKEKYFSLLKSVSHAIYGNIRQQAMGNIYWCLRNGVKLYLYKDSVIYKQLKIFGYKVFTIDDDLSEQSLKETLSKQEAKNNYDLFYKINKSKANAEEEFCRIIDC